MLIEANLDVLVILPKVIEKSAFASDPYSANSDLCRIATWETQFPNGPE